MPGPSEMTGPAMESRWVVDSGLVLGASGGNNPAPGLDLEFRRRFSFGAHDLKLGQLNTHNHWSLDLGVSAQAAGWADSRPRTLVGAARFGVSYNLLNIIGVGPTFRFGYGNASDGDNAASGAFWSAGGRFGGIIDHLSASAEIGYLSMPAPNGETRDKGAYGMAMLGYLF